MYQTHKRPFKVQLRSAKFYYYGTNSHQAVDKRAPESSQHSSQVALLLQHPHFHIPITINLTTPLSDNLN